MAASDIEFAIDEDEYSYRLDKGPLTDYRVAGETDTLESIRSLRVLALRKGFSAAIPEMPGHYIINTHETLEEQACAFAMEAPLLVTFHDSGQQPCIVTEWKWENDKIYAMTISTALHLSTNKDSGSQSWLNDKDVKPVKLSLLKEARPVVNSDGQPLLKTYEEWLKNHSDHFKSLKVKSYADCRAWCQHSRFEAHMKTVNIISEKRLQDEIRSSVGDADSGQQPRKKPASTHVGELTATQQHMLKMRLPIYQSIGKRFVEHASGIACSLGKRLIELDIPRDCPAAVIRSTLVDEIKAYHSKEEALKIAELISRDSCLQELTSGTTKMTAKSSPLKESAEKESSEIESPEADSSSNSEAPKTTPKAPDATDAESPEPPVLGVLLAPDFEAAAGKKRARNPTTHFTPEQMLPKNEKKAKPEKAPPASAGKNEVKAPGVTGPRGKYKMSGLYSRDPLKAAVARAKLEQGPAVTAVSLPAGSSRQANFNFTSWMNFDLYLLCCCTGTMEASATRKRLDEEAMNAKGAEISKLQTKNAFLELEVKRLTSELDAEKNKIEVAIQKKELEITIEMTKAVEAARQEGFKACQEQMELLAKLKM